MALAYVRAPLLVQPAQPRIDVTNPHARGLVFAWDAALDTPRSLLNGETPGSYRLNAGAAPINTSAGRAVYLTGAFADNLRWGNGSTGQTSGWGAFSGATETTVEILFRPRNTTQTPHSVGSWNNPISGNHWLIQQNNAGLVWIAAEDGSSNRRRWDASSIFTANQWTRLLLSWRGGSSASMWIDGRNRSSSLSAVNTAATSIRTNPAEFAIGSNRGGTPNFDIAYVRMWRRGMSDGEAQSYQAESPWSLYEPRRIWVPVNATAGVSGTVAYTNANDADSITGTTTVVGTSARTNAADTSSASGTTTVTGTSARTNANDTSAASGTTTVTGTLARTNANDTSSASGTVGSAGVSGSVAYTNAADTSLASGTTTVVGSAAVTAANDTSAASGTTAIVGTVAYTNANDTCSATDVESISVVQPYLVVRFWKRTA